MQLHIRHETCYVYEETVSYSIQSLKLTPRAERGQRVLSWRITLPGERLEQIDPYGNVTHVVTMEAPHKEMRIVVEGIADIAPDDAGNRTMPPLDGDLSHLAFLAPTVLTRANGRLREITERHLGRHPASRATLLDLVAGVRNAVEYEPGRDRRARDRARGARAGQGRLPGPGACVHRLLPRAAFRRVTSAVTSSLVRRHGERRATPGWKAGCALARRNRGWLGLDVTHNRRWRARRSAGWRLVATTLDASSGAWRA